MLTCSPSYSIGKEKKVLKLSDVVGPGKYNPAKQINTVAFR